MKAHWIFTLIILGISAHADETTQSDPANTPTGGTSHFCDASGKVCIGQKLNLHDAGGDHSIVIDNVFPNGRAYYHVVGQAADIFHQKVLDLSVISGDTNTAVPAALPVPTAAPMSLQSDSIRYNGRAFGQIAHDTKGSFQFISVDGTFPLSGVSGQPKGPFSEAGYLVRTSENSYRFIGKHDSYRIRTVKGTPRFKMNDTGFAYRDVNGQFIFGQGLPAGVRDHRNQSVPGLNVQSSTQTQPHADVPGAPPGDPIQNGAGDSGGDNTAAGATP